MKDEGKCHRSNRQDERDCPSAADAPRRFRPSPREEHHAAACRREPASSIVENLVNVLRHESNPQKPRDVQRGPPLGKSCTTSGGHDGKRGEEHSRHEQIMAPRPFDKPHLGTSECTQHPHKWIVTSGEAVHREDKREQSRRAENGNCGKSGWHPAQPIRIGRQRHLAVHAKILPKTTQPYQLTQDAAHLPRSAFLPRRAERRISNKPGVLQGRLSKATRLRRFRDVFADDVALEVDGISDLL